MEVSSGSPGVSSSSPPKDEMNRREPLLSSSPELDIAADRGSWRLNLDEFRLPDRSPPRDDRCNSVVTFRRLLRTQSMYILYAFLISLLFSSFLWNFSDQFVYKCILDSFCLYV